MTGKDGHTWQVVIGKSGSPRWLPKGRLARGLYVRRESAKTRKPRKPRRPAAPPRPLSNPALVWIRKNPGTLMKLVEGPTFKLATTREGLLEQLRVFRDGWEAITTRNQDLSDERLAEESTAALRAFVKEYASAPMRAILAAWLAELLKKAVR
ncbi:MAG: hypothetical protein GQE15_19315 [Archangiaceae bacterium]|nr:hypothetical protein [Archangiaceae bacterium]